MSLGFRYAQNNIHNYRLDPFPGSARTRQLQFHIEKSQYKVRNEPHQHNYVQIWYLISGSYMHHFNGIDYKLGPGSMVIVPPMFGHFIDSSNSTNINIFGCSFSEEFIANASNSESENALFDLLYLEKIRINCSDSQPYLYFEGERVKQVETLLEELYKCDTTDKFSNTHILATMTKLLNLITQEYRENATLERDETFAKYRITIQKTLDYIDMHYTEHIHLTDVCKIAMMSSSPFSQIFKHITGKTFIEYLNYHRVLHARELLTTTDRTLYDICRDCGFQSDTYFGRVFKAMVGCQPGVYRKLPQIEEEC